MAIEPKRSDSDSGNAAKSEDEGKKKAPTREVTSRTDGPASELESLKRKLHQNAAEERRLKLENEQLERDFQELEKWWADIEKNVEAYKPASKKATDLRDVIRKFHEKRLKFIEGGIDQNEIKKIIKKYEESIKGKEDYLSGTREILDERKRESEAADQEVATAVTELGQAMKRQQEIDQALAQLQDIRQKVDQKLEKEEKPKHAYVHLDWLGKQLAALKIPDAKAYEADLANKWTAYKAAKSEALTRAGALREAHANWDRSQAALTEAKDKRFESILTEVDNP